MPFPGVPETYNLPDGKGKGAWYSDERNVKSAENSGKPAAAI